MLLAYISQRTSTASRYASLEAWLARPSRVLLAGGLVFAASHAPAVELIDPAPAAGVSIATDSVELDSVLVETREGEPLEPDEVPELEPISAVSDDEPELAEPPSANEPPPEGDVGPRVVRVTDSTNGDLEPRVAAIAADGGRVLADVAKDYATKNEPRPAKFHGVTPGLSTRAELIEAWGEPDRVGSADGETTGGSVLGYDLKPFEQVEALVEADKVTVVRVTLDEDTTVGELATRLKLTSIEPVDVTDPTTSELLAVAFPEKGLTLLVKPTSAGVAESESAGVSHLVLEPIDARAFVLRAEQRPAQDLKAKLNDLRLAIEAKPTDAHAQWLKATQHLAAGQAAAAETAAAEAIRLAPEDAAYRVTHAEALRVAGDFDQAVIQTRQVLDDETTPRVARAQAMNLMGRLAAMGDQKITAKVIDFHNAAIEIADSLATSTDDRERHLAKDLLVSSHLAVAKEIARRDYADKAETVAEWIGRASGFAEERIESDGGGLELRLQVAREALAALAEMRPTKDPAPWLGEAQTTAEELLGRHSDPLFRAGIHWQLGEAHQHAVRIEHLRGDATQALGYGATAIRELAAGAEPRTTSPAAEQLVGQLYFYLGAVNAVHKQDHAEAVGWYDKGREILLAGIPESEFVVPRRDGEELVSMGVSYWDQSQRDLAVELTENGARLMERGVSSGVIQESSLAVPYGNLATMYEALENATKASEYRRLVRGVRPAPTGEGTKSESTPVARKTTPKKTAPANTQARRPPTSRGQQASPSAANPAPPKVTRKIGRGKPKRWQR